MKKVKKVYGVYGMMEYQAIITIGGKSKLRVTFTEGSATAGGQTPATYTTDNLMFQHAIENSKDFKSGRIRLIKAMELTDDVYIASDHEAKAAASATTEEPGKTEEGDNAPGDAGDKGNDENNGEANDASADTLTPKEFACLDDARDFFEGEYGVDRAKLRTTAQIVAVGKANGFEVTITE